MKEAERLPVLDGWRATSILLVMTSHLLWLGPKWAQLNFMAGAAGMALFFTLSGFLIVSFLYGGMPVGQFLLKRITRIVPLAWLAMAMLALWGGADRQTTIRNLLFVANLPPADFLTHGEHLWSLGMEMQFYAIAALLVLVAGRRGMLAVPVLCFAVTLARIVAHETLSIVTWHRADEILAGGILAILFAHKRHLVLGRYPFWLAVVVFLLCSHPATGVLQYLRPYAAAALVGATLVTMPARVSRVLVSKPMHYVAKISYALYVVHAILAGTWLGSGEGVTKYVKRPLLFAATFALAHLSTKYFEQPVLQIARRKRKIYVTT